MMAIFEQCDSVKNAIFNRFDITGKLDQAEIRDNVRDWVFTSNIYRRAHISVVDARETHKLWLLHVTVFPHLENGSPIYGFDIVAGLNKVSGAFHDFSPVYRNGPLCKWFHERTADLEWNKRRELPEWAKPIFSEDIVAIGAVGIEELEKFCTLGLETLDYYLADLRPETTAVDFEYEQNFYCTQQRKNPHTPRVLQTLGFTEEEARNFVENNLFPLT